MSSKAHYQKNRVKICEKQRAYYYANREEIREKQRDYQPRRDRIRTIYDTIIARCYLSTHHSFGYYGGRGIRMCQRWLNSYEVFKEWLLANGWKQGLHVHRIDNNGDYSPENCKVVTAAENNQQRTSTKLDWEKVTEIRRMALEGFSADEIAKTFGVSYGHTRGVITRRTWKT